METLLPATALSQNNLQVLNHFIPLVYKIIYLFESIETLKPGLIYYADQKLDECEYGNENCSVKLYS